MNTKAVKDSAELILAVSKVYGACQKQFSKQTVFLNNNHFCPACGQYLGEEVKAYCADCGQALERSPKGHRRRRYVLYQKGKNS